MIFAASSRNRRHRLAPGGGPGLALCRVVSAQCTDLAPSAFCLLTGHPADSPRKAQRVPQELVRHRRPCLCARLLTFVGEGADDMAPFSNGRHRLEAGSVTGCCALAAGGAAQETATSAVRWSMPDPVPVLALGRSAVDGRDQGMPGGPALLQDTVMRAMTVRADAEARALAVHAPNGSLLFAGLPGKEWRLWTPFAAQGPDATTTGRVQAARSATTPCVSATPFLFQAATPATCLRREEAVRRPARHGKTLAIDPLKEGGGMHMKDSRPERPDSAWIGWS